MAGYTRQSSASIVNGSAITAPPLNAEFNQLLAAFHASTGHGHTGGTGDAPKIPLATSVSGFLPIANGGVGGKNNTTATSVPGVGDDSADGYAPGSIWENTSTGRIYICVGNNSGAAVWRELVQVTSLNAILPVSNNSVDIGSSSLRFQDLFLSGGISASGNAAVGGTLTLTGGTALNSTLTVTGVTALNGGLTMDSNKFTVANTSGNVATAGTLTVTGATALNGGLTMDSDKFTVANTSGNVATAGTLAVTGTSAFTGVVTANAGVVVDNITIDGTEIDLSSGDLTLDVAGDIILNADGGDISLQDGSATFGSLTNSGGNLVVKGGTTAAATFTGANVDFAGTVDVTGALTADSTVAVAGVLSPATHVDMPDNAKIKLGTGDDATLYHDGTNSYLTNATGALKISTETSGGAVTIGHTTSEVTIGDNLTVAGNLTVQGTQTVVDSVIMNAQNAVVFEGATADDHETTLTIVDPTADRTINLPNQSGTLPVLAAASNDQVTATPAELSIMDGDKSAVSTTLADADRVVVNDAGTMKQVALTDFETYMETSLDTLANVTTVGALNAGTITSGFGAIDNGSSAITTSGTVNFGSISDGTITITGFVDEDNMASNSATLIPTQQSVEARIQAISANANNVTGLTASGAELNILDNATLTTAELNILDGSATTQATVTLAGTDGVVISDADVMKQALVSDFDTYISGTTKTLTNKTLSAPTLTGTAVVASLDISGDIDVDGTTNLDVVDIDGAVNMATTLAVGGDTTVVGVLAVNKSSGYGNVEVGGPSGGFIDLKAPFSDDYDARIIYNAGTDLQLITLADEPIRLRHAGNTKLSTLSTGINVTGNATFADNGKAIFGAGSDLQIYHNVNNSIVADTGSGILSLQSNGTEVALYDTDNDANMGRFITGGAVKLFHNGNNKFETTATGIDVTGTVTSDGLTVAGNSTTSVNIAANTSGIGNKGLLVGPTGFSGSFVYKSTGDAEIAPRSGKDLIFAASTGGTERMRINSDGKVGIGASSIDGNSNLQIQNDSGNALLRLRSGTSNLSGVDFGDSGDIDIGGIRYNNSSNHMQFTVNATERMRIKSDGKVGISQPAPAALLHIGDASNELGTTSGNTLSNLTLQTDTANVDSLLFTTRRFSNGADWNTAAHRIQRKVDTSLMGFMEFGNQGSNLITFGKVNNEFARIDGSGNLLVGSTNNSPATNNVAGSSHGSLGNIQASVAGNPCLFVNRKSNDGDIISLRKDGSAVGSIGVDASAPIFRNVNGDGIGIKTDNGQCLVLPYNSSGTSDNDADLGSSGNRFDDIFATNGTIQTSDRNEKQDIASLTATEMLVGKRISALFKTFRWKDKVVERGDNARTHTGIIAQDVQSAFTAEGLDAGDYSLFISTTWWETQTDVPAVEAVAEVTDEDGNVTTEAVEAKDGYTRTDTYKTEAEAPEGATERTRMGIRYPELLSFVAAYNEQRFASIEARITALEG